MRNLAEIERNLCKLEIMINLRKYSNRSIGEQYIYIYIINDILYADTQTICMLNTSTLANFLKLEKFSNELPQLFK